MNDALVTWDSTVIMQIIILAILGHFGALKNLLGRAYFYTACCLR